jgi:hypothetical protein
MVAELSPKVLGEVGQCRADGAKVSGEGFSGWLDQTRLFGVYPDETLWSEAPYHLLVGAGFARSLFAGCPAGRVRCEITRLR